MKANIGTSINGSIDVDVLSLVDTRALIQANSGGGKSWLLRLLAERVAGHVQTVILDAEGEFSTLREKVDMLLVGDEGEVPADVRSAKLLARKLAELRVSAVIDLYELKLSDRRRYVRVFLESLMAVPRKLWHPMFIMLDEAHLFCPERSAGEAESTQAVISLMSQGRKRGFSGILCTQRLSKLHKDAAAECNNVCIGRTHLDIDLKRAADILGMTKNDAAVLRILEPGGWYAFGPAFTHSGVEKFYAAKVATSHPEAGKRHEVSAPVASAAIRKVLPELQDLPAEAEKETQDLTTAKARIIELERAAKSSTIAPSPELLRDAYQKGFGEAHAQAMLYETKAKAALAELSQALVRVQRQAEEAVGKAALPELSIAQKGQQSIYTAAPEPLRGPQKRYASAPQASPAPSSNANGLPKAERAILAAVGPFPQGRSKVQIALMCGYSHKGGGFNNALSSLRSKGLIDGFDAIRATDEACAAYGPFPPLPTGRALLDTWLQHRAIGKAERSILETLYEHAPMAMTKEAVAEAAGYQASGGGFNNALSRLRTLELISRGTEISLNPELVS